MVCLPMGSPQNFAKKKKIDFLEVGEKMCSQRWSSFLAKLATRLLWARSQNMQQLNCFVGDRPLINIGHYLEIKRLKKKCQVLKLTTQILRCFQQKLYKQLQLRKFQYLEVNDRKSIKRRLLQHRRPNH